MKFSWLTIGILLPFHFGFSQTLEVLPEEISPGVAKTEMMAVWLKKQAIVALDQRDAAFEKLTTADDLKRLLLKSALYVFFEAKGILFRYVGD